MPRIQCSLWRFLLFEAAVGRTSASFCYQEDANESDVEESAKSVTIWSLGGRQNRLVAELLAAAYEDLINLPTKLRHFNFPPLPECLPGESVDILMGSTEEVPCGLVFFDFAGYIVEHGIFYWLPNSTANDNRRWPFDWYLSHVQDPTVPLTFEPLNFTNLSVEAGGCTAEWNAAHPLPSGRPWCDEKGRFVPAHCEGEAKCGELYHAQPWWTEGAVEALILTHKLPYVVRYIGFDEHAALMTRQKPFIALGWEPGRWDGFAHRVQFPVGLQCNHSHDGNPETPHPCDSLATPVKVYTAPGLERKFPPVVLLLQKFSLTHDMLWELLKTSSPEGDSEACAFFRKHRDTFRERAGRCVSADQLRDPERQDDCGCSDGLVWNETEQACTTCPPNAFCFRAQAIPCGHPYGIAGEGRETSHGFITSPGRRRRAQGPDVPDDCICAPGYGLSNDFQALGIDGQEPVPVCQPCAVDFYKSEWAAGTCTDACPPFSEAKDGGASNESDCTCKRGYYLARSHPLLCKVCPPNEDRDRPPGILCLGSTKAYNAMNRTESHSAEPYALPGWVMVETGSLDSAEGRTIVGEKCPTMSSCLGNNTCRPGTHGPLCSVCVWGYVTTTSLQVRCSKCDDQAARHAIIHLVSIVGLTLYVNCLYSIVSGDAAKKASLVTMMSKLIYHNAFLTWPVATYPIWVAWTAPQAAILDGWVFHQRCFFMHLGVESKPGQALAVAFTVVLFPLLALLQGFLWCRLIVLINAKSFAKAQVEVDRAGQLLNMCDWLEDLHVRNGKRLDAIKAEFRRYQVDRIDGARVSHIWRVCKRPDAKTGIYRLFLEDSVGLVIVWMVVLYPLVTAEVISSFHWWRPLGWTGERLVFGTLMTYFGSDHTPLFVLLMLFLCVYCVGFPILCLWKINNLFQERKLLQGTQYEHWGYLQYTFELRSPAIYTEVMHMAEQTFMALMATEASLDTTSFVSSVEQPIIMFFLVLHCWAAPYDKIAYGILHRLMGVTVLVCVLTAEVAGYDRAGYGFDAGQLMSTVNSVVNSVNNGGSGMRFAPIFLAGNMVCILVFNIIFWFLIFTAGGREMLHRLYSVMSLFSAKDTGTLWDTFKDRFLPLRWFGNFYEALLDLIMVLVRLATHSKEQCLSVTMEMKQTGDRTTREIVLHEQQRKKLRRVQSTDSSNPGQKRASKRGGIRALKKAGKEKRSATAEETAKAILGKSEDERRVLDRRDRGNMALAMSEAMETLFVVHGLDSLPCCIMEFILADALYFVRKGPREERRQRQTIFSFVWKHGSGQVRGLEELFEGGSNAPVLSNYLRWHELRETATKLSTEIVTESLLISDLQRYVRHLRFEEASSMQAGIEAFAEAFRRSDTSGLGDKRMDRATQTSFLVHQAVQVENMCTQETQTETLIGKPTSQQEAGSPAAPTGDVLHEEALVMREEAAAAWRESELLLSEVVHSLEGAATSPAAHGPVWTPGRPAVQPPREDEESPARSEPQGPLWTPKRLQK